jgi:hypothetical protein
LKTFSTVEKTWTSYFHSRIFFVLKKNQPESIGLHKRAGVSQNNVSSAGIPDPQLEKFSGPPPCFFLIITVFNLDPNCSRPYFIIDLAENLGASLELRKLSIG